jgi:sugar/nucleoside kinase (ribokinase family)
MAYDLVAIGNPVYDEIITPFTQSQGRVLSGCSTNACLAAKRLGLKRVGLIGCIGADYEAPFRQAMAGYGVDLVHVKVSENTGGFRLIYDAQGNRTLDVLGVADSIHLDDLPSDCFRAKTVLIAPILQEVDLHLLQGLRAQSEATLFLDPQGLIRERGSHGRIQEACTRERAAALPRLVDVVKPNEHEAQTLTEVESPYTAARLLIEWGAKTSIVTLAERGSIVGAGRNFVRIPPYKTSAVDPTGAGDTYIGAFITKFLEDASLFDCGIFASAAASIKVEHSGPDFPVTRPETCRRVRELLT